MNRNIINSFKNIFRRGSGSITKIILLGIGLAMGLTLIAKLYFENSYESFVPDRNRVYRVVPLYEQNGEKMEYYSTPGAIAPGIKLYSAAVESATRVTYAGSGIIIKKIEEKGQDTNSDGFYCETMVIADSCFFKIFPRQILAGDADKTMQEPNTVLISRSMADKMLNGMNNNYSDLIGKVVVPQSYENKMLTIGAVYDNFPHNSEFVNFEIVIPIISIKVFTWDGTNNWIGNDRYMSYIKLFPNTSEKDVRLGINKMCEERILPNLSEGTTINYNIISLKDYHTSFKEVKQICLIMLILAIVVLVVAILNYILITLSSLVRKAKMVAVRKCYGASRNDIYALVFSDTFVEMFISLLLAVFLVFTFEGTVERIVGTSLSGLLSPQSIVILTVVLLIVFLTCGIFPAAIYSKTPVATAFRNYKESNR
ncbi:MAG: ABC transporter permease, partial [Bacteroidales bacterium]|nr:ABC transporter permease [Bacteroidales bacterium]